MDSLPSTFSARWSRSGRADGTGMASLGAQSDSQGNVPIAGSVQRRLGRNVVLLACTSQDELTGPIGRSSTAISSLATSDEQVASRGPTHGVLAGGSLLTSDSAIGENSARAASRSSTISAAMTSGGGRFAVSSSDSSRSQIRS